VGPLSVSWGPRYGVRDLGVFRNFCPICRKLCVFLLREHLRTPRIVIQNVLSIPTGVRSVPAHSAVCATCKSWWWIEGAGPLVSELESETGWRCAPRLELEERARKGEANPGERTSLLLEPLQALRSMTHFGVKRWRLDPVAEIVFAGTYLLMIALMIVGVLLGSTSRGQSPWLNPVLLGVAVGGALLSVAAWLTAPRRFLRGQILPRLVSSLSPLNPTSDEIQTALDELRRRDPLAGARFESLECWNGME
jgi:hypothetical protein